MEKLLQPILSLPGVSQYLQRLVDDAKVAGAIALVEKEGRLLHVEGSGYQNIELQEPIRLDGIFRIASLTKSITSFVALKLIQQKCFKPNYCIGNFVPQFDRIGRWDSISRKCVMAREPIRIHHLLTHTSGISYDYNADPAIRKQYQDAKLYDQQSSLEDLGDKLADIPLNFEPGARWSYGASTDLLGLVLEKATNTPLDQLMEEHLFAPMGLQDTGFHLSIAQLERLVSLYTPMADGGLRCLENPMTEQEKPKRKLLSGGGGLYSSLGDYYRIAKLFLQGGIFGNTRLIDEDMLRLLYTNQLPNEIRCEKIAPKVAYDTEGQGFGYGFLVRQDGSYGWAGAANTYFWARPAENSFSLLFAQLVPFAPFPMQTEFLQAIE